MAGTFDYGIEERKQTWIDFLSMENEVRFVYIIHYQPDELGRPDLWPEKKDQRIEWAWEKYCRHMERMEWLRDDSIPYLDMLTGTEIFAEAFGCKVYRAENQMPFALPLIHSASEVSKIKVPELSSSTLAYLFDMADQLVKRAGSGAVLRMVDIQSPMDIASLIWDKNDLYMAMIETPEAVKELAYKVKQLLTAFMDEWFKRYGKEFIAHFPDYFMPMGVTLSEDEVGAVSQEMFGEFFLDELNELSDRYGGIGIHCCAHARHQWGNFKKVRNLRLLNLVQPEDILREAYNFFACHVPQMHSWGGDGSPWEWPGQYPDGSHVVIHTTAKTKGQALKLSEQLWNACLRG